MAAPLATRCPACSTVFRVVPDQLRVSEGWVRCGRCAEVFDATASLVDLETGAPRQWQGEKPARPATHPPPATTTQRPAAVHAPAPSRDEASPAHAAAEDRPSPPAPPESPGLAPLSAADPVADAADFGAPVEPPLGIVDAGGGSRDIGEAGIGSGLRADPPFAGAAPPAGADAAAAHFEPSFVRRAERAAYWRRPGIRAALVLASLLAAAALPLQAGLVYRDLAAARFPALRPLLAGACGLLGCRIEAARAIEGLAVESSGLVRIERSSVYRLTVALRNRTGIDLALPAMDLSLTDVRGRLIVRRVLHPDDFAATPATIDAGRERILQATLRTDLPAGEDLAGYTIELFYP